MKFKQHVRFYVYIFKVGKYKVMEYTQNRLRPFVHVSCMLLMKQIQPNASLALL